MRNRYRSGVGGLALAVGLLSLWSSGTEAARAQTVTPVASLDLTRFSGTWFEIARLPDKDQKKCSGDAMALYGLEDKATHFSVVTSCSLKDDTPQIQNQGGKRGGTTLDGRLETSYFVFLHHQTWVIGLDPAYQWAMVGSPNHKNLWIYARSAQLDPAVTADLLAKAAAEGFNVGKVVMTPQSEKPRPKEVVRPSGAVSTGVAP